MQTIELPNLAINEASARGRHVEIPLTQGMKTVVSEADARHLMAYRWFAAKRTGIFRAARCIAGTTIQCPIARLICGWPDLEVDHINRNALDNRRENLRVATRAQNMANRGPFTIRGTAKQFKGTSSIHGGRQFVAMLHHKMGDIYLGCFDLEDQAAIAFDDAAYQMYGEFAYLNFPERYPAPKTNIEWPEHGSLIPQGLKRIESEYGQPLG